MLLAAIPRLSKMAIRVRFVGERGKAVLTMADLIDREAVLPILAGLARTQGEYDASYDKLMQIPSASRWISCAEQLPERETDVLVYIPVWEDNPIQVAYLM